MSDEQVDALEEELAVAKSRIAELEAALKPFAEKYTEFLDDGYSSLDHAFVSVGDLRQARKALGEKKE